MTRQEVLRRKALGLALDDADGDRGDVAPPAVHMPRSNGHSGVPGGQTPEPPEGETPWEMESRCLKCGADLSARDADGGGYCEGENCKPELEADGDSESGVRPAIQEHVGGNYQAPPPPGAPLRMAVISPDHPINPNKIKPPKGKAPAPGKSIGAIHVSPAVAAAPAAAAPAAMREARSRTRRT